MKQNGETNQYVPCGPQIQSYKWGTEFESGGAGSYLAIIPSKEVSIFYVQHVLGSPAQQLRGKLRQTVIKDLQ